MRTGVPTPNNCLNYGQLLSIKALPIPTISSSVSMLFTVIFCVLSVTAALSTGQLRIVDGQQASPGQFPYQANLRMSDEDPNSQEVTPFTRRCGGSLISDRWVLTAAHCLQNATKVEVFLGDNSYLCSDCVTRESSEFIIHEKFYHFERIWAIYDIALVKLPIAVELNDLIQPIQFARTDDDLLGRTAIVSGWGDLAEEGNIVPMELQFTEMKIISNDQCAEKLNKMAILESTICGQGEDKRSVCGGDSGGPLVIADKKPLLIGVVSFGDGCEDGLPGAFARVSQFAEWIENHTGIEG